MWRSQCRSQRRIDDQLRETKQRIAQAVAASKTATPSSTELGRSSPRWSSATSATVTRFASSDRFAAYNGTAPIEVSSGPRTIHQLSRRGNRRLNHAIHMAAVTQIRRLDSQGRAYYDKKIAEGKGGKEALRALKRRISDAIFRQLLIDAERQRAREVQSIDAPSRPIVERRDDRAVGACPRRLLRPFRRLPTCRRHAGRRRASEQDFVEGSTPRQALGETQWRCEAGCRRSGGFGCDGSVLARRWG
ncbi:MAG: transposase [Acidimicrobiales bacterium]